MGRPTGTDRFGKIIYEDKSYELKNAPFNDDEAEKYSKLYIENKCAYAIKPGGILNNFNYRIEDNKVYIASVSCDYVDKSEEIETEQDRKTPLKTGGEYLPRQKVPAFQNKNILYEMFNQKEQVLVSWFSGKLELIISMENKDIGSKYPFFDYQILNLIIDNGEVIYSYKTKRTIINSRRLQNYIEE